MAEHTVEGLPEYPPGGRDLTIADMFPPPGTRYFTDEQIERLRQAAMPADGVVTLTAWAAMCLICDWRNMTTELADQDSLLRVVKAASERIRVDGMWGPTAGQTTWSAREHLAWREEELAALAALPSHLVERLANVSPEISARLSEGAE